MKTLRFEVPHFCCTLARSSPKQSSHKNIRYLLVALATVSVFALGTQASAITEDFSTPSTQAGIDVNYPQWSFIPADQDDLATVTVEEGQLQLGGDRNGPTKFQLKTAPIGAFVLDVDLGAFPGDACLNIGIQVGPNDIVFHPGFPGTALRVDGPGGFFNIDIGFTLEPAVLHHFKLISDGRGFFIITLIDSLNGSNVYSTSFSNPGAAGGLISIRRAGCSGSYGEVHADNFVIRSQECTPPPLGLVSWWPGDDNADDIRGYNDGTPGGNISFAPGMVGQAFSFDGVDSSVLIPASATLNLQDFTIDAWVFPTTESAMPIVEWHDETPGLYGTHLWLFNTAKDLYANVAGTGDPVEDHQVWAPGAITPNAWNHVALTFESSTGTVTLYRNSEKVAQEAFGAFTPLTSYPLFIGRRPSAPEPIVGFEGLIDEVEIFDRPLSPAEIQAIFNACSAGKCKAITVDIDIKPGSYPNCFNINSHGVIPVAILGNADLDVTLIDVSTLDFAGLDVRIKGNGAPQCSVEDVTGDGYLDLVCQFVDDSTWTSEDGYATLSGNLLDGTSISGIDEICIVP
jgi:hypothetical protein